MAALQYPGRQDRRNEPNVDDIGVLADRTAPVVAHDGLLADVKPLSGIDAKVLGDEELLRMVLPAVRSDYRAIETYGSVDAVLGCPITALIAVVVEALRGAVAVAVPVG
ncbi:thioesterase domain-containing protein [Streptomyces sp. AN091965]|uniref:thioesterase domain-containing protein n=1 Tax=Streptomyces sp. AN091965 TaxID=2927803 RepID=UPI0027E59987|nr:thioesterase domain-containing protein [Streptomyces sp. AN091965]